MAFLDRLLAPVSPTAALRRALRLAEQGDVKQAFPLLARAARAGIAEAEYRVGRCYLEGTGVPPSRAEGARWLERAANQGYVEAQAQLATLAIHGLIARADDAPGTRLFAADRGERAGFRDRLRWARKAAEGGSADGQAVLGYILTSGPEPMRDLEEAHRWYERSAAAGCSAGCPRLCPVAGTQCRRRGAAGAGGGAPAPCRRRRVADRTVSARRDDRARRGYAGGPRGGRSSCSARRPRRAIGRARPAGAWR